ncbi:coenzyme F420-0:L-glutamate ligase [Aeromicrobium wangtongii]|uniref:Coenzyme F420-0:L-glutamate ligase n=1 Tax=Aeromicrobium wangtongii TaxID=2969247 RepID=A0ABY5MBB0_9ACTN|nr:coenzyme F420-0:L-glutamate ligase [Aeromicrobium wangtongii]MCD9196724.1 coenzyme F420-0:L-glutamate ligase [Aeromicrobium wangtongii]UUP14234.1 coenzyme F420-0:L-glutamate ligase [Aeromicrobium wangtongii]
MTLIFEPLDGIGEVAPGDDVAALIAQHATLQPGDVVVVTSKIVSKAAGLATTRTKDELLADETDRVVARRGPTSIVRTHHGLTMAAAGIDNSNTAPGTLIPLPPDPDASAAALRSRLRELTGVGVAVVISDTAGRAWRVGQTDIAIGCAGLLPVDSYEGRTDPYGNPLAVTAPAIADQLAGGAELASGKFGARPVVIVRGADPAWLTEGDGPGARSLIRDEETDMFGLGAREAAVAAIIGDEPVPGLPADPGMSLQGIVDLAMSGLSFPRRQVAVDDGTIVVSVGEDDHIGAGVLAQRLVSIGIAHGTTVGVRITALQDD